MMIENFRERDGNKIPLFIMWMWNGESRGTDYEFALIIKYKNEVNVYRSIFVDRVD